MGHFLRILAVMVCGLPCLASDWTGWRGPTHDGICSDDSGWDQGLWPPGGPLWEYHAGPGASSPLVVGDCLYTVGWRDGQDRVVCLDMGSGREQWAQAYPCPPYGRWHRGDESYYSGPSATPAFDSETGLLFTLSTDGDLNAWDTRASGEHVWGINLYEAYGVPQRPDVGGGVRDYGYTTSPLVYGDWLVVAVGAPRATVVAFGKRTGQEVWASEHAVPPGHCGGLVPITVDGLPCLAVLTLTELLILRLDPGHEGQTLATYPWATDYANNIATPAVCGQSVVVTSNYNQSRTARLDVSRKGIRMVWEAPVYSLVCSPVIHNGRVYLACGALHCLDLDSGRLLWSGGPFGNDASILATADDRLVVFGNHRLALVDGPSRCPSEYHELTSVRVFDRGYCWPHVVLSGTALVVRNSEGLVRCYGKR